MKIKKFTISHYGPLENITIKTGMFNLFYGNNEQGKTLIIDALIRLLIKSGRLKTTSSKITKLFRAIHRVEHAPEGYVVVEYKGKDYVLNGKKYPDNFIKISPHELRNIFVIRDSDLTIEEEAGFYSSIMDRLTGLRTEDIERIRQALLKLGKLTDKKKELADTEEAQHIKSRYNEAKRLLQDIESINNLIKKVKYDEYENQIYSLRHKKEILNRQIEKYNSARNRKNYEKS